MQSDSRSSQTRSRSQDERDALLVLIEEMTKKHDFEPEELLDPDFGLPLLVLAMRRYKLAVAAKNEADSKLAAIEELGSPAGPDWPPAPLESSVNAGLRLKEAQAGLDEIVMKTPWV